MSMNSNMSVESLLRQLALTSEEAASALDDFQSIRREALMKQQNAVNSYESELKALGDIGDVEITLDSIIGQMPAGVDHNIMRHANLNKSSNGLLEDYEDFQLEEQYSSLKPAQKKNVPEVPHPLGPAPTTEQKGEIREKMFSFIDFARMEEMRLELECERLRELEEYVKADIIADSLLLLQKRNCDNLKHMIEREYQPTTFHKHWGNDPEYMDMSEKLKSVLRGELAPIVRRSSSASIAIGDEPGKISKKKGHKKK